MPTSREMPSSIRETKSTTPIAPRSSTKTSTKNGPVPAKSPYLSVVTSPSDNRERLSRGQVAERIGASVATVRRYEGNELSPQVDEHGVHWFDVKQVTALASKRANEALVRGRIRNVPAAKPEERTKGEIAALVFERFEQRQSQAEIVIGVRVEPEVVHQLFDDWCVGLIERQLRKDRPNLPRRGESEQASLEQLCSLLAQLPPGQVTRISVGRWRGGDYTSGGHEYDEIIELGGFHVSGPCAIEEITRRFGSGKRRITAYGFDPPGLRWELLVDSVTGG